MNFSYDVNAIMYVSHLSYMTWSVEQVNLPSLTDHSSVCGPDICKTSSPDLRDSLAPDGH